YELAPPHCPSPKARDKCPLKLAPLKGSDAGSAYVRFGSKADICIAPAHVRFTLKSGHLPCISACPLCADTVEKIVSDPEKRHNRIRTEKYLTRKYVRGRDIKSIFPIQGSKIVFQQYRPEADMCSAQLVSAKGQRRKSFQGLLGWQIGHWRSRYRV